MDKVELLDRNEETDADVTWEDQQSINAFSRLNKQYALLEADLEKLRDEGEILDDVENELLLASADDDDDGIDDDAVTGLGGEYKIPFRVGDGFVCMTSEEVEEQVAKRKEAIEDESTAIRNQLDDVNEQMATLKKKLYAKFGKSINLEK